MDNKDQLEENRIDINQLEPATKVEYRTIVILDQVMDKLETDKFEEVMEALDKMNLNFRKNGILPEWMARLLQIEMPKDENSNQHTLWESFCKTLVKLIDPEGLSHFAKVIKGA